ncbi:unnamed protein product [Rotaria sordida]|uniref:DUF8206 domain-containing protein n=1 Tax=Rotaria sordida TaxID=392033 RepID=A0A814LXE1_9BILA|nr:unnamed protein product [Rotaria sordida]CAF0993479.1 unnamed protein product [Rotaria sordida]CAF1071679.1 unnamed protein product [Rotaria sordida]
MIDTPGIGDTRGFEQDKKNFTEILSYIAQYKHLNGLCILLKPDEQRLTIPFRFCVNELLRHLPIDSKDNIIFIFTNARSTFFAPGSTTRLIQTMLNEHKRDHSVEIPFSRDNTFLFDNEPFRYLALRKNGITLDELQTQSYIRSWDHSVQEYCRLMSYLVTRPFKAVSSILSLNEAEQLVRMLPRPIAETSKLIEQNIQLAKDHKQKVLENPELTSQGIPQNVAVVTRLKHPRTVCVGENCCQMIDVNNEKQIEYICICHEECYLKGVKQETLYDEKLQDCTAMDPRSGDCEVCGCHWLQHKHITYEHKTKRVVMTLNDIDQRISDLRGEALKIQEVYKKVAIFLHANAIVATNDDILEYLQYFIREEQMKQNAGASNADVIAGLVNMMKEFTENMELLKKTLKEQKQSGDMKDVLKPDEVFKLVTTLYKLSITGAQIQQQVEGIRFSEEKHTYQRERYIELPARAASSKVMKELKDIVFIHEDN